LMLASGNRFLRPSWYPHIAIWIAVLFWSGSFLANRAVVTRIPPLLGAGLRFSISSVLLLLILGWKEKRFPILPHAFWGRVTAFGFVLVTLGFGFENAGLARTSAGNASVLVSLVPAFTILLASVALKERLAGIQWFGVLCASAGSILLAGAGRSVGLSNALGDGLVLIAVVLNAAANLIGKQTGDQIDPMLNLAYGFAIGSLLLMPAIAYEWQRGLTIRTATWQVWWGLVYLIVPSTAVAFSCFFYAASRMRLAEASLPLYFMSIITLVLSALFFGEPLTLGRLIGGNCSLRIDSCLQPCKENFDNRMR
jgi:drug/metabolite transporter (DMT)-like permease